jgi:hypothetical protein
MQEQAKGMRRDQEEREFGDLGGRPAVERRREEGQAATDREERDRADKDRAKGAGKKDHHRQPRNKRRNWPRAQPQPDTNKRTTHKLCRFPVTASVSFSRFLLLPCTQHANVQQKLYSSLNYLHPLTRPPPLPPPQTAPRVPRPVLPAPRPGKAGPAPWTPRPRPTTR